MNAELFVRLGGAYSLAFAAFHLCFWRLFDWERDLATLQPVNRAVMQVLNLSLTWAFVAFGLPCLLHAEELVSTPLGRTLLLLIALLWLLRALEQVVFFGLRKALSVAFLVLFLLGSALHGLPLFAGPS